MNFVTFGNETINLDNVTHIEQGHYGRMGPYEKGDDTTNPFIRFHFAGADDYVTFAHLTWDNKIVLAYLEARNWLQRFQAGAEAE